MVDTSQQPVTAPTPLAEGPGRPLKLAMDATAVLGATTGVGQMVKQLAARLPRDPGLDLTGLLISWRGRSRFGDAIPSGWAVKSLPLPARLTHLAWRRTGHPKVRGFDVVHGPNYVVPPTDDGAARLVTVHDMTAWRFPELVDHHSRFYPQHVRRAVEEGADVHAVSSFVADEIRAELDLESERIHVVPNGYQPVVGGDAARARTLVGAPYVLAIGTVEPRKDYVSLVRAMADVWPIIPDLKLVIAGADGWGADELNAVVDQLGVADRIRRLGYVSDPVKADLLAGAELLAYPSIYEGFGLPLLEAMGAGVPVVSTSAGAIREIAGRAAVLVEPRDPSALAGALLTVLEDPALRVGLAEAGRQRVDGYSWDAAVEGIARVYRQLADRSCRPTPSSAVGR